MTGAVAATAGSLHQAVVSPFRIPQEHMSEHPIEYRGDSRTLGPELEGIGYPPFDGRGAGDAGPTKDSNLVRYFAAVLRFKWLILLVTFVGAAAGVLFARTIPNMYRAQATLWFEAPPRQQNSAQPIRTAELLNSQGWVALLRSFSVMDAVVREERLYLRVRSPDPNGATETLLAGEEFTPGSYRLTIDSPGVGFVLASGDGVVVQRGTVGDSIGTSLGISWVPPTGSLKPDQIIEFSLTDLRAASQILSNRIEPVFDRDVTFLTLALTGTDAVKTTSTVNAIADQYVRVAAELKQARMIELSGILREQLEVAESKLHNAEVAHEAFRVNTITLPSDPGSPVSPGLQMTQDPVYDNYFQMKIEREQMQQDRSVITRVLNEARSGPLSVMALEAVPSLSNAPSLQAALAELTSSRAELRVLQQRYTEQNAQVLRVREKISELENRTIPTEAAALLAELDTRDGELAILEQSASRELRQIPPRVIEEARLRRTVDIAERLFTLLQSRYEEAHLAAVSSIPDVRSLDAATVPQWATNGGARSQMILILFLGSFGLAVGGAILLDRFDPKVRYPDQVTADMGLPILGAVPFVRGSVPDSSPQGASHAIEAFREIRMNALYALRTNGSVAFTVSSAEAGDGKSFISANLALSFAQQGNRTLVIDGDIRRGRLHHFLKGRRTPGLSDLLAQRATLGQVLQQTEVPLVSLIGSGTRMHLGPELLGSTAMLNHIQELKRQFDVIIIDTPPLGAGVDPYVLAALTGNLLMVVRTGNTNRAFAEAKLKLVDRLPVRIIGAVLNGIPANQRTYRYYSYLPNYGSREEAPDEAGGKALVSIS
jgi:capsular exopolysaccharide synthesis family protein